MPGDKSSASRGVRQPGERQVRKLVVLLDGTWQTDAGDTPPTNIVRLGDFIGPKSKMQGTAIFLSRAGKEKDGD